MMLKKTLYLGVVILSVLSLVGMAQATLTHNGSTDPATEGWTLDSYGTGSVSGGTDTEDYWRVQTDANAKRRYLSGDVSSILTDPTGWTMTTKMKANVVPGFNDAEITVYDGTSGWEMSIMADGVWSVSPSWGQGAHLSSIDPTLTYHTYQMVFDPAGNASGPYGAGIVNYYLDGNLIGTSKREDVIYWTGGLYRAEFGDASDGNPWASDSQWSFVQLETGQNVIPEPTTLLLLSIGAFASLRRK